MSPVDGRTSLILQNLVTLREMSTCLQTRLKTHTGKLILVGPVLVREGLGRECCTDGSSDMQYTIELVLQGQYPSLCVTLILYALMYLLNRQSYKSWAQLLIDLNV